MEKERHILSIVPYKVLPATSGGHLGIVLPHHYVGQLCHDHVVSTEDNGDNDRYSFQLHKLFPASAKRYIPFFMFSKLKALAEEYKAEAIYCDHPYMALTAIRLSRTLGIPWFIRNHNVESMRFKELGKKWWPILWFFERYALRKADGIFVITPEDEEWLTQHYKINPAKCHMIPYGTILNRRPEGHAEAKASLAKELNLDDKKPWLYFLGALDYMPNSQAISFILDEIMPRLDKKGIAYEILIAGKNIPQELEEKIKRSSNIRYMGFIPDLDHFLKACDVMLNPVMIGGGIKTKAVEALGYNKIVVSSVNGAAGLVPEVCDNNLYISPNYDWDRFTEDICTAINTQADIPESFYKKYYWGNIAQDIMQAMLGET